MFSLFSFWFTVIFFANHAHGFAEFLTNYATDQLVPLTVNVVTVPGAGAVYDYYDSRFGFCSVDKAVLQSHSLGAILSGERIYNSPFTLKMMKNESCQLLCTAKLSPSQVLFLRDVISTNYTHSWYIDNLPVVRPISFTDSPITSSRRYVLGFPLGESFAIKSSPNEVHLYNHFKFTVQYHKVHSHVHSEPSYRVVGAFVEPMSQSYIDAQNCAGIVGPILLARQSASIRVPFTYEVIWEENDHISWGTRWDTYLGASELTVHYIGMISSLLSLLGLSGLIMFIMMRTLRIDILRHNELPDLDTAIPEAAGWKTLCDDVFRPPRCRMLLSVLVGSGAHIFVMVWMTVILMIIGLLTPANRDAVVTTAIISFSLLGFVSGFVSSKWYRFLHGTQPIANAIATSIFFPGAIFILLSTINTCLLLMTSSGTIPFWYYVFLIALFVISVILCLVGALIQKSDIKILIPLLRKGEYRSIYYLSAQGEHFLGKLDNEDEENECLDESKFVIDNQERDSNSTIITPSEPVVNALSLNEQSQGTSSDIATSGASNIQNDNHISDELSANETTSPSTSATQSRFPDNHKKKRRKTKSSSLLYSLMPRPVQNQHFLLQPWPSCIIAGAVPFAAVAVEFYFMFTSFWFHRILSMMGFVLIAFLMVVIMSAETSIIMTYLLLSRENHRWWWRSFMAPASGAFHLLITCTVLYFFIDKPTSNLFSFVVYMCYSLIGCLIFFLCTGAVGHAVSFYFVTKIYGSIRAD